MSRQETNVLEKIRKDMDSFVGQEVSIKANTGRKKVFQVNGILEQTYPKVFVVRFRERQVERRVSYSYADLLTEAVEITIGDTRIGVQTN
ncbi:Veg family protein [Capillibacterium thermochitinicola]|nr:Veg family protein [Capillibacterium thermochitinicola]